MEFRETLKKERLSRGWTLKEMGEKLNRSANAIYHYEKGNRTIDSDTLRLIATLFDYEWKKKTEKEPSTSMKTKHFYTEKQFNEYKTMKRQWTNDHDESDVMNRIHWNRAKEKWVIEEELNEVALEQMDERMDYEETEAIIAHYLEAKEMISRNKYSENYSRKEQELVDECNRLVDQMEHFAQEGNLSDYQTLQRRIGEIEEEVEVLRQEAWDFYHLEQLRICQ